MSLRPWFRIVTFAYAASLPVFYTMWIINVLPEILQTNFGFSKVGTANGASLYFSSFFYGIIVGCFAWPYIGRLFYKRTSLMIGLLLSLLFNTLMGHSESFTAVCIYRFLTGIMHNLNSVGKDFIFEFAHTELTRQYGFNFKSSFNVAALFGGPYIGYKLYNSFDKSFERMCDFVSLLYVFGIVLFFICFYLDYKVEGEIQTDLVGRDEEERKKLLKAKEDEEKNHAGMLELTIKCLKDTYLRGIILTYIVNNAINKSSVIFMVMICTFAWADGGLGLSTGVFSVITVLSFIPAEILVLTTPMFVPKSISRYHFIKVTVFLTMLTFILVPLFRITMTESSIKSYFVYFVISLIFWVNPKQFSPFVNYLVNSEISKNDRTTVNSLLFLSEILGAAVCLNIMAPIFTFSFFDPAMTKHFPYNVLIPFVVLAILLSFSFVWLRTADFKKRQEEHKAKGEPFIDEVKEALGGKESKI